MKRKAWLMAAVVAAGLLGGAWGNGDASRCRWCGSGSYGAGCPNSPVKVHEHRGDEGHCEWCGSVSFGTGCPYGPTRKHRHGAGERCIWCGSASYGLGCPYSPTERHER